MSEKYYGNVHRSDEDNCFIATCSEFPLLSAHGDSEVEAISEFQHVFKMVTESLAEDNIELPKPKSNDLHSGQFEIQVLKSRHSK